MPVDVNTLAVKVHTEGAGAATRKLKELGKVGGDVEQSLAGTTGASKDLATQMIKLAGVITITMVAYHKLQNIINIGMRVETMATAMGVVAKNAGISSQALEYFTETVKDAGITSMETYANITKAMVIGVDLNKMKELATRARDIAVLQGLNTSEAFARIMHGIQSQGIEVFRTMGVMIRPFKEIFEDYAASIGKTAKELNAVDKANAALNEVMRATERYAGAAAAADAEVGKQIASMTRYAEEAYLALWALFGPAMEAGVQGLTKGFKELKTWAESNRDELAKLGASVGETISWLLQATIETTKWAASNADLVKGLLELYILMKVIGWIMALAKALQTLYAAISVATGGFALMSTAQRVFIVDAAGVAVATDTMSASLQTLQLSAVGAAAAIAGVFAAWAYGAYKWQKDMREHPEDYAIGAAEPNPLLQGEMGGVYTGEGKRAEAERKLQYSGWEWEKGDLTKEQRLFLIKDKAEKEAGAAVEKARKAADEALKGLKDTKGKGKGGGGADKSAKELERADKSLRSLLETLDREVARATGSSLMEVAEWSEKVQMQLEEIAKKGVDVSRGRIALDEAEKIKLKQIDDDYTAWYAQQSNDRLTVIEQETDKLLNKYIGTEEQRKKILASGNKELIDAMKKAQERESEIREIQSTKTQQEKLRLEHSYNEMLKDRYQQIADLTPVREEQIILQREALRIENEIGYAQLQQALVMRKDLTPAQKERLLYLQQQLGLLKEARLMEDQGYMGAIKKYGREKRQQMEQAPYEFISGVMGDVESAFGNALRAGLNKEKVNFEEFFNNLAVSFMERTTQLLLSQFWGALMQALMGAIAPINQTLPTSAATAGNTLAMGGFRAGQYIEQAAVRAAAILSKEGGGKEGGGGGFLGWIGKAIGGIFGSIFKGGGQSSIINQAANAPAVGAYPMQHGGIIKKPTLVLAGEKKPEVFAPLDKLPGMQPNLNVTVINETGVRAQPEISFDERGLVVRMKRELVKDMQQKGEFHRGIMGNYEVKNRTFGRGG